MPTLAVSSPHMLLWLWRGGVSVLLLGVLGYAGCILATNNFHAVVPGQAYRSAQLTADELTAAIRRYGIRTVVNLRGPCVNLPWYLDEARVTAKMDVAQEDVSFSATRLPSALAVRQLVEVLDHSEYPILMHCQQGADRTGLAAVMVALLRTDATLAQARRQLGLATGHVAFGKTRHVDRFFDQYEAWLHGQDVAHTPDRFRDWLRHHYCPVGGRAAIVLLDPPGRRGATRTALRLAAAQSQLIRVRCYNRSEQPWHFQPGNNAGIKAWIHVVDHDDRPLGLDQVGRFHARVLPGEAIDLAFPVLALVPGRYQIRIDLADEQHATFLQLGSEPLVIDLEVT